MADEVPPYGNCEDPEIERAFDWMVGLLDPQDWRDRVVGIERQLEEAVSMSNTGAGEVADQALSINDDRAAWYLYLAQTSLYDAVKTEPAQASRVLPILKRLGSRLEILRGIPGADERARKMLVDERRQPDGILLELLVALLWRLNGWEVEFLPERPERREPDIRASSAAEEWFVECKRLQQNSDYSQSERNKWRRMWIALKDLLFERRLSAVFDIVFHVPLEDLTDSFFVDRLAGVLRSPLLPGLIVDDPTWTVSARPVDYGAARRHLSRYLVKFPGDQVNELVGGHRDPNRGFSCAVVGRFERLGPGLGNNRFLDELQFATGAFWSCDAPAAIERKARDIRRHIARAIEQLPAHGNTAIHVAIETMDGPQVEMARQARIVGSMLSFDTLGRPVPWVYCHLIRSYSPPNVFWTIDETDYYFGPNGEPPLGANTIIVPPELASSIDGVHWLRQTP